MLFFLLPFKFWTLWYSTLVPQNKFFLNPKARIRVTRPRVNYQPPSIKWWSAGGIHHNRNVPRQGNSRALNRVMHTVDENRRAKKKKNNNYTIPPLQTHTDGRVDNRPLRRVIVIIIAHHVQFIINYSFETAHVTALVPFRSGEYTMFSRTVRIRRSRLTRYVNTFTDQRYFNYFPSACCQLFSNTMVSNRYSTNAEWVFRQNQWNTKKKVHRNERSI